MGLQPAEAEVTGLDAHLSAGRFFAAGDDKARHFARQPPIAALVGIGAEDVGTATIALYGEEYQSSALFDSAALKEVVDLDGERLTPVDTVKDAGLITRESTEDPRALAATAVETFNHLEVANTLFLPYQRVPRHGRPFALHRHCRRCGQPGIRPARESFMSRVALTLFVGQGDRVVAYSSIGSTEISGAGQLLVPVIIAALIVLNTMMGAVYERVREIGIYRRRRLGPQPHRSAIFGRIRSLCHLWRGGRLRLGPNCPSVHAAIRAARWPDAQLLVALCGVGYRSSSSARSIYRPCIQRAWRPTWPSQM